MNRSQSLGPADLGVSRETFERLAAYHCLLKKWNRKINLVAPGSLDDAWIRHFQDSLQILDLAPDGSTTWVDLGSGGGFPGAVVAVAGAERRPNMTVTLIESDQRKAAFLRSVARETGTAFTVIAGRIEDVSGEGADVVSARALAPLDRLIPLVERHLAADGVALLQKGAGWRAEVDAALEHWRFRCQSHPSKTDQNAVILEIGEITRV